VRRRLFLLLLLLAAAAGFGAGWWFRGRSGGSIEDRARETAEQVRDRVKSLTH
jgi:hypothetical protein